MKFLFLIFVHILIVNMAWSAVSVAKDSRNPDYPDKCFYGNNESFTLLSPGEEVVKIEGKCLRVICFEDFGMQIASCGAFIGPEGRILTEDYSLPYPDCCPHKCRNKNL